LVVSKYTSLLEHFMQSDKLAVAKAKGALHNGKRAGEGSFSGWGASNASRGRKKREAPSGCKYPGCGYKGFHGSAGCPVKKQDQAKKQRLGNIKNFLG
jgi:hypothetical protein